MDNRIKQNIVNRIRIFTVACLLLMACVPALRAQTATYPVQAYTQLIPPYTPYAPTYYSGLQEKLKVTLINSDMQQPVLSVYLRMRITSSIFSINTPDEVFTPPIQLQAGVPVQISRSDLAPYFQQNSMRISGGQAQFYRTQMLPDNFYRFHFEVYETNTRRLLSNPRVGFAQAMITAGDPPILNLPKKGEVIVESNIPNILFTWTPRHMTSVAAAYGTEYEISLAEIYDKQTSPENAFQYSRILYTEHTRSTSFIHTAAQPLLIPGMRYAWRVKAVARDGLEDANVFKNEGYSEIFWFDYSADCAPVQQTVAAVEKKSVLITWTPTKAIEYTVEYRRKGSSRWYPGTVSGNESHLHGLEYGVTYEYRIGSRCVANDVLNCSALKSFTMPDRPAQNPECGLLPEVNLSNRTPAEELLPGMPIFVGDFPVFISTVTGGNGRFSGTGYVGIPFLGLPKVAVLFNNIFINSDLQLVEGFIEVKYDENGKSMMVNLGGGKSGQGGDGGGGSVGDNRTDDEKAKYTVNYTINPNAPVEIKETTIDNLSDEIKTAMGYNTSDGRNGSATVYVITLEDSEGNKHDIVVDSIPATVTDKDGNTYEITRNENGSVKTEKVTVENNGNSGGNPDNQSNNPDNQSTDPEGDLNIYFIIQRLKDDETPGDEMAEKIVKTVREDSYYSSSSTNINYLDEGKYICIPVRKDIQYTIYNSETDKHDPGIKKRNEFTPYGIYAATETVYRLLSWQDNPINRYTITHTVKGKTGEKNEGQRYTVLDLNGGDSDSLFVEIYRDSKITCYLGDGNKLPSEINSGDNDNVNHLKRIELYTGTHSSGKLKVSKKKQDAEIVSFEFNTNEHNHDGSFGFDKYDERVVAFKNKYETFNIKKSNGSQVEYVVSNISMWMGEGKTVKAKIKKNPQGAGSVYYQFKPESNNLKISNVSLNGSNELTGENRDYELDIRIESAVEGKESLLVLDKAGNTVGKLNIYSRKKDEASKQPIKYKIVSVSFGSQSSTMNFSNYSAWRPLEDYFNNRSYNQAFLQFKNVNENSLKTVIISDSLIINAGIAFDRTSNILEDSESNIKNIRKLLESESKKQNVSTDSRIIFVINNREMAGNTGGFGSQNTSVVLFLPTVGNQWRHYIHEIGHSLGLSHPFEMNSQYSKGSTPNFMDYSSTQNMFWRWQWKIINSTDFSK